MCCCQQHWRIPYSDDIILHMCCEGSEANGYTVRLIDSCYLDTATVKPMMEALSKATGVPHVFIPHHRILDEGYLFNSGLEPNFVRAFILDYKKSSRSGWRPVA